MWEFEDTADFKDAPKKPVRLLQRTEAARVATSERLVSLSMLLHDRVGAGKAADWGGTNLAVLLEAVAGKLTTDYDWAAAPLAMLDGGARASDGRAEAAAHWGVGATLSGVGGEESGGGGGRKGG